MDSIQGKIKIDVWNKILEYLTVDMHYRLVSLSVGTHVYFLSLSIVSLFTTSVTFLQAAAPCISGRGLTGLHYII